MFMFGITHEKPTKAEAARWDRICKEEGGYGFIEVNRRRGEDPGTNHGAYQGWFTGPNLGAPFDQALAVAVEIRIKGATACE